MSGFAASMAEYVLAGFGAGFATRRLAGRIAGPSFWMFNVGVVCGSAAMLMRMLFGN